MTCRVKGAVSVLIALALAVTVRPAAAQTAPGSQYFVDSASQDPDTRIAAIRGLSALGLPAALDRIALIAQADVDARVRLVAVGALAGTHIAGLQPLLEAIATRDRDPAVRARAADGARLLAAFAVSPGAASGFSTLCPGCGYIYLGQPGRAAAYLGATAALVATGALLAAGEDLSLTDDLREPRMRPSLAPLAIPALIAAQNLWTYGIFASYRDARLARGDLGYRYPISREDLGDLAVAPFRPRVLARPWFWVGLPLMVGAAVGFSALVAPDDLGRNARSLSEVDQVWFLGRRYGKKAGFLLGESYYAGLFLPVGIGEEALFRGAIQPAMTEWLGLWPGWAVTSILFGGVHAFNFIGQEDGASTTLKAVPFITVVGSVLGLTAIKTGFQLETSVAQHFWYDFLLGTISFVADPHHQPFTLKLGWGF
jgi:membrane protease YdiL (CAAX protease family)